MLACRHGHLEIVKFMLQEDTEAQLQMTGGVDVRRFQPFSAF